MAFFLSTFSMSMLGSIPRELCKTCIVAVEKFVSNFGIASFGTGLLPNSSTLAVLKEYFIIDMNNIYQAGDADSTV
ncbi:hypothetical protein RhiirA4_491628 [Rhizophagus irregularis]|uniref:Uncharacterized protein n=1 Tax=Rhizophagus irregularis TaxID=588596 RepID=A0A2I1HWS0_9GLOM|nr:hypothetical protein RhiirA4_491628 [Rhizophagus irregularis]